MGRKSDYAQMHNKENKKTYTFDQVKEKFGRKRLCKHSRGLSK